MTDRDGIRTTVVVAVLVLLVLAVAGMGFRQLWYEGVFNGTTPSAGSASIDTQQTGAQDVRDELREEEVAFLTWMEQEVAALAVERRGQKVVADSGANAGYQGQGDRTQPSVGRQGRRAVSRIDSNGSSEEAYPKKPFKSGDTRDWSKDGYAKSGDSKEYKKVSISEGKDVYANGEGEQWHVTTLPDGTTTKVQVLPDGSTGEVYTDRGGNSMK